MKRDEMACETDGGKAYDAYGRMLKNVPEYFRTVESFFEDALTELAENTDEDSSLSMTTNSPLVVLQPVLEDAFSEPDLGRDFDGSDFPTVFSDYTPSPPGTAQLEQTSNSELHNTEVPSPTEFPDHPRSPLSPRTEKIRSPGVGLDSTHPEGYERRGKEKRMLSSGGETENRPSPVRRKRRITARV